MASIHILSQGMLLAKTVGSFQRQMFDWNLSENKLLQKELAIQKKPQNFPDQKIAFVADHLEFGCADGVDIFKVTVHPFQSLIAIRHGL